MAAFTSPLPTSGCRSPSSPLRSHTSVSVRKEGRAWGRGLRRPPPGLRKFASGSRSPGSHLHPQGGGTSACHWSSERLPVRAARRRSRQVCACPPQRPGGAPGRPGVSTCKAEKGHWKHRRCRGTKARRPMCPPASGFRPAASLGRPGPQVTLTLSEHEQAP